MSSNILRQSLGSRLLKIIIVLTGVIVLAFGCSKSKIPPPFATLPLPPGNMLRITKVEVTPAVAKAGDEVSINVTYEVLPPDPQHTVLVTETWSFKVNGEQLGDPIIRPTQYKTQGSHFSTYKFIVSRDSLAGAYQVQVTISNGAISQFAEAQFSVLETPHTQGTLASPSPAIRKQVRRAQTLLRDAGFDPGPIDGVLGPATKAALQRYQTVQGLPVTGELDDTTRKALGIE
jgi:hypothetical protein